VTVDPERDQIAASEGDAVIWAPLLGDVADSPVAVTDRLPEEGRRTPGQAVFSEDRLEEAGLARAIRAEHGDELARAHVEIEIAPQHAASQGEGGRVQ
jgi:hypothetical protein